VSPTYKDKGMRKESTKRWGTLNPKNPQNRALERIEGKKSGKKKIGKHIP